MIKSAHLYRKELFKRILFIDEKIFTVEEKFNRQNDTSVHHILIQRQRKSSLGPKRPSSNVYNGLVRSFIQQYYPNLFLQFWSENDSESIHRNCLRMPLFEEETGSFNKIQLLPTNPNLCTNGSKKMFPIS